MNIKDATQSQQTAPADQPAQGQASSQDQQAGAAQPTWDSVQQTYGLTPEKAAKLAQKEAGMNSFFDAKSKEIAAEKRSLDGMKQQYQQAIALLNDPNYVRQFAQQQADNTGEDVDEIEVKMQKQLQAQLAPLAQSIQALQQQASQQRAGQAEQEIRSILTKLDGEFPGFDFADTESQFSLGLIADVQRKYGDVINDMSTKEIARAFRLSAKSFTETLQAKGFSKIPKDYVDKKKQQAAANITEGGAPAMGGTVQKPTFKNREDFFKHVGDKFRNGLQSIKGG